MKSKGLSIPLNIKAEVMISLRKDKERPYYAILKSAFERNFENDLLGFKETSKYYEYLIAKDSLYHLLPEGLFHRIDRYKGISHKDQADKFKANWDKQEEERKLAINFFQPLDNEVFHLRVEHQENLNKLTHQLLIHQIIDEETVSKIKINKYIKRTLGYIPFIRNLRADKQKIRIVLEKVLQEELKFYNRMTKHLYEVENDSPAGACRLAEQSELDGLFCGTAFEDSRFLFLVNIQKPIADLVDIQHQEADLIAFKEFFHDYFLSVEEDFEIEVGDFTCRPVMDAGKPLYLGYNTQLI